MKRTDLVAQAVRLALAAGMAGVISTSAAYAQDEQDEVAVQQKITVTGSRIKRTDIEGPQPITVLTREEIDASGELTISELLRTQTFNTFGSPKQMSGHRAGSVNTVNMRGLGPGRTLVLLNGRRMASAPIYYAASVQNLSMIPMAAVDRIEVLRDGASAIYGADALAGVINIILRRDYTGMHFAYDVGRPEQSGGDEDSYSITGGVSGGKGNVTFGFEAHQKEIVFNREREFTSVGLSRMGFPSSYFAYLETDDSRNPTGDFLSVGAFPDPRCPEELQSDPDFPWSVEEGELCRYAYWGESAQEAEIDTKNFFLDANYEITDRIRFFTRGLFSHNEAWGRYAPMPTWLTMSQDTPQNPTNPANPTNAEGDPFPGQSIDVDTDGDGVPDTTVEGPFDLTMFYRNIPGGNRDTDWDDTLLDYVAGVRGTVDWLGGTDWELGTQWSEQNSDNRSSGLLLQSSLQSAVDEGEFDLFGVFRPYGDDERAAARSGSATATADARHRITGFDGQISFDAFNLDNGPVAVALGFEYRDEDYDLDVAEQSESGGFAFTGLGIDTSGARVVKSLFAETLIPVLSPLELNLAVRYDDYNDFGTTVNPKASVAFRPLESLLLRANWGQGFQAPNMDQLYSPPSGDFDWAIDSYRCSLTDADADGDGRADMGEDELPWGHPCGQTNFDSLYGGNRDLDPQESENWTVGFAWSPTRSLTLIADYYDIHIDDEIGTPNAQDKLDEELRLRQAGATGNAVGDVTRRAGNRIDTVSLRTENITHSDTNGMDMEASVAISLGRFGDVSTTARWTHVFEFVEDWNDGEGGQDRAGEVYYPQDRGQFTVNWNLGDFAATAVGNYVGDQKTREEEEDYSYWMDSFTTWDVQLTYATPWNGQVTLGARNVFDEDPPRYEDSEGDAEQYDLYQHEIFGRVPYIRLEQDF
jgi:iron complex outermembrane receptor protein